MKQRIKLMGETRFATTRAMYGISGRGIKAK